ncbi:MAG: hypothetical protein IJ639_05165 [Ruminococcus sp.]|nr:hypothetical protein [Ruminococcus sp.]
MKKLLSLTLTLVMLAAILVTAIPASAQTTDDNVLIVSANGENPTAVEVGNEFIVRVGLYAGDVKILNGQVRMEYDADCLEFDPYAVSVVDEDGEPTDPAVEHYSFPTSINNSGIVLNYAEKGIINYNFTRAQGVAVFNNTDKLFARFRFKATAAGKTDISHVIQYMINTNEERIYYKSEAYASINPYTVITIEPAEALLGDIDGDYDVTILDATDMQRAAAGVKLSYDINSADVTGDKKVSLKDSVAVRKYLAAKSSGYDAGKWIFASEK